MSHAREPGHIGKALGGELSCKRAEGRRTVKLRQISSRPARTGHCFRSRLAVLPFRREPGDGLSFGLGPWRPRFPRLLSTACKDLSFTVSSRTGGRDLGQVSFSLSTGQLGEIKGWAVVCVTSRLEPARAGRPNMEHIIGEPDAHDRRRFS
jgi:hypothetical protein